MSESRDRNLHGDLSRAREAALFIEVMRNDLSKLGDNHAEAFDYIGASCEAHYDQREQSGLTNVMVCPAKGDDQPLSLFKVLLDYLADEIGTQKKKAILNKLSGIAAGQLLGGATGELVGEGLGQGTERLMELYADWMGGAAEYVISTADSAFEVAANNVDEVLSQLMEASSHAATQGWDPKTHLQLSRAGRRRLQELIPELEQSETGHQALQLALAMLVATAIERPKVLVIDDPLRLDSPSWALLAMLVSLEKDLRQSAAQHGGQEESEHPTGTHTTGVSVVLCFSGAQLSGTGQAVSDESMDSLNQLRTMASRYYLLERVDSDIPVPAVRASTFVGRVQEIAQLFQAWESLSEASNKQASAQQHWAVIVAEPGVGKTALANEFISRLRADPDHSGNRLLPSLRLLNQTGHSAKTSGLASLKHAIAEEIQRLSLIYRTETHLWKRLWQQSKNKTSSVFRDMVSRDSHAQKRTLKRAGKVVTKLLGVDSAIEATRRVGDYWQQGEMIEMAGEQFGESALSNRKEEQFDQIREGLKVLQQLVAQCDPDCAGRPFVLMVDDLQWIDELTAEFLSHEWPSNQPVMVVATARGSDSLTVATESDPEQEHQRSQLFAALGLIDLIHEVGSSAPPLTRIELPGMDQPMLVNLIEQTFLGINRQEADVFAEELIRYLAGGDQSTEVVSLYAIEALNMLSDPNFYSDSAGIAPLIQAEPGVHRYRYHPPQSDSLKEALQEIFTRLSEAHAKSYEASTATGGAAARFNLASYAVMQERLNLIERYFGQYGGTARISLLMSAWVGSPFDGELVQYLLKTLRTFDCDSADPALMPLIDELRQRITDTLTPEHYQVLERAYEIIRRLESSDEIGNRYEHQHDLMRQFLLGQLTRWLDELYPETESLKSAMEAIVKTLDQAGEKWFEDQGGTGEYDDVGDLKPEQFRAQFKTALAEYWHRRMMEAGEGLGVWAQWYSDSLHRQGLLLQNIGRHESALRLHEQTFEIERAGYEEAPERWARTYVNRLNNVALCYVFLGAPLKATPLVEQALEIAGAGYEVLPKQWSGEYASSLNNLALCHVRSGAPAKAVTFYEQALEIRKTSYEAAPERWAEQYVNNLINLASCYNRMGQPERAEPFLEDGFQVFRAGYGTTFAFWGTGYAAALSVLARCYERLNSPERAAPLYEQALEVRKTGYEAAPARWAEEYAQNMNNLAVCYDRLGDPGRAMRLLEQALDMARIGYNDSPARWAALYATNLNNLASCYDRLGDPTKAFQLYGQALEIQRPGYEEAPERWAADYARSLSNLAACHERLGAFGKSVPFFEEELEICKGGYEVAPECWAEDYASSLHNLAHCHERLGDPANAAPLYEQAVEVTGIVCEAHSERGAEAYARSLNRQAFFHYGLDDLPKAAPLFEQALEIQRAGYEVAPERWAEDCANSLNNLAACYLRLGDPEKAAPLFEQALEIHRARYEVAPERWEEAYVYNLNNLAACYNSLGNAAKAVLIEQALQIVSAGYNTAPEHWAKDYTRSLNNLAVRYERLGHPVKALLHYVGAQEISKAGYEAVPERWAEIHPRILKNLASFYQRLGDSMKAASLYQQALEIQNAGPEGTQ